ncbi:hypothetical protein PHMEG_00021069 [Phytophthora megakarya]|uniref:Helitron helicase n=1 Tax=Phytophthora megakarya TaxID=4795 RepID=A0A225VP30_9STRA|nr:hypothetical protein PHMEG_00021069 [Phytophthora megakarya]
MAGSFTTEQQARMRQMHLVHRQVVEDLLAFYCEHNVLYENVPVDSSDLAVEIVEDDLICEAIDAEVDANDVDTESDRVGSTVELGDVDGETDLVEHRVVFIADDREVTHKAHQLLLFNRLASNKNLLFARMSPTFSVWKRAPERAATDSGFARSLCPSLQPIEFPTIRRGRAVHTGEFRSHYCTTHVLARRTQCQRDPVGFKCYSAITEASLIDALRKKERNRQGRTTPVHDDNSSASDFLRTVELSSGVIWGSDSERAQCRRRAFVYQARYGLPALFVTLTPNITGSFVMVHYTGISTVDTLFDANLAQLPRRSALHSAGLRNDVAFSRLFMHNMDAVMCSVFLPSR